MRSPWISRRRCKQHVDIFGDYAFRKRAGLRTTGDVPSIGHCLRRGVSNWPAVHQSRLPYLVERREDVQHCFIRLMTEDGDFEGAVSLSTGTTRRVQKRFQAIKQLVEEFV